MQNTENTTIQDLYNQQIKHYADVLCGTHDKMLAFVDEQADNLIYELQRRYEQGLDLPTPQQLREVLPTAMASK